MCQKKYLLIYLILIAFANCNLFAYINLEENITKNIDTANLTDSSKGLQRIEQKDFMYSDNFRYTLSGDLPLKETKIKAIPAIISGTVIAGMFVGLHQYQSNTIWKDKSLKFRIAEDMYQELYLDKIGHFYGGYLDSYIAREALIASGISDEPANIWGSVIGLAYQSYIEVLDGYGDGWGFSPSDFYFDAFGSGFFLAQYYVPFLQNFTPKFIYIPGSWSGDADRKGSTMFMDNYSSQMFFISINLGELLPKSISKHYPKWLQPSIGYRVKNLNQEFAKLHTMPDGLKIYGDCKYLLSFDVDLVKLLPDGPPVWNWFKQSLNHFKVPSPTIEFSERGKPKIYLFYPFSIKLSL